jgi:hypothetical protein
MASQEIIALSHVEILHDAKNLVDFKTLLDCVEEHAHELLNILLLETLGVIPLKAPSEVIRPSEGHVACLKRREQLLELVEDAVLLLWVLRFVVPIANCYIRFGTYCHL